MEELAAPQPAAKTNRELVKRFRATGPEVQEIQRKATQAGLSFSEYCRRAALDKEVVERVPLDLRQQLGAAGNNLNQLTKLANAGKLPGIGIDALNALVRDLLRTLR